MDNTAASSMNEDALFDELIDKIEAHWFRGAFPQLKLENLVAIIVKAVLEVAPQFRQADERVRDYFAKGFSLALARKLTTAEYKWLN